MQTLNLELKPLRIPFKVTFKHASAERNLTQGVLVIARSAGLAGYGEGCPRDYVTGETDASVAEFFARHRDDIGASVTDLASLRAWSDRHEPDIDKNPAAWCAIELALLDLFAKRANRSVESLLGLPPLAGPFVYSAVLGAMAATPFAETLDRYQKLGMREYKIKLAGNIGQDRANLAALRSAGIDPARVRADANNLWSEKTTAGDYLASLDYRFGAIEEPLRPGQFADIAQLADSLGTRVVLDESIARKNQLARLPGPTKRWVVNIRVSKMGGLLRSLAVAQSCRSLGLGVVVGAQVGETSLLTRAALTVAQSARDILIGQEGAYGTFLLQRDLFEPCLMFGPGGKLDVSKHASLAEKGFGLMLAGE